MTGAHHPGNVRSGRELDEIGALTGGDARRDRSAQQCRGFRLAAATAAGATPDSTRLRTATSSDNTEPASVDVPASVTRSPRTSTSRVPASATVARAGERDGVADEQQPIVPLSRVINGHSARSTWTPSAISSTNTSSSNSAASSDARRAMVDAGHRVEQVRGGRGAGFVAGAACAALAARVAERDGDAAGIEPGDQLERAWQLRRDGDEAQLIGQRRELACGTSAGVSRNAGRARLGVGRQKRSLEVETKGVRAVVTGRSVPTRAPGAANSASRSIGARDRGRKKGRDSAAQQRAGHAIEAARSPIASWPPQPWT